MSVAFRRESDDEHKEPEFELPIPVGPNWVTPRGRRLLSEEVDRLKAQIADQPDAEARKKLQRQLRYFDTRRATADVQSPPADGSAGLGCRINFRLNNADRVLTIVGCDEADPRQGQIAFTAPLARAMMGAYPDEMLAFQGRDDAILILSIAPDLSVMT